MLESLSMQVDDTNSCLTSHFTVNLIVTPSHKSYMKSTRLFSLNRKSSTNSLTAYNTVPQPNSSNNYQNLYHCQTPPHAYFTPPQSTPLKETYQKMAWICCVCQCRNLVDADTCKGGRLTNPPDCCGHDCCEWCLKATA